MKKLTSSLVIVLSALFLMMSHSVGAVESPDTQLVGPGSQVSGTFPEDVSSDNGVSIEYEEEDTDSDVYDEPPGAQNIVFGTQDSGTFPDDLATSDDIPSATVIVYSEELDPGPNAFRFHAEYEFSGVPQGADKEVRAKLWMTGIDTGEDILFQVLTPPDFWQTRAVITDNAEPGGEGFSNVQYFLNEAEWNGGTVMVRLVDDEVVGDVIQSEVHVDSMRALSQPTDWQLLVIYTWTGVPAGFDILCINAWRDQAEDFEVLVITPPATQNVRMTISFTTDSGPCQEYQLTAGEFNGGGPIEIRFVSVDGPSDPSQSSLFIDQAVLKGALPEVTTLAATPAALSAVLRGNLDVTGIGQNEVYFQYGTTMALGTETVHRVKNTPGAFQETVVQLQPETEYHFRACAESEAGESCGSILTFTTLESSVLEAIGYVWLIVFAAVMALMLWGALWIKRRREGGLA